jgi:CcmD family protein
MYKFTIIAVLLLLLGSILYAQDTLNVSGKRYQFISAAADTVRSSEGTYIVKYVVEPEMADKMRSDGKIYVVITVLATIFAGIFAYLVFLDRKISRLEKEKKV